MAAMLSCGRVLFLRSLPKASWSRSLSSDSSENGNRLNIPLSSLMKKLKHPAPEPDLSKKKKRSTESKKSVSFLFANEQEPLTSRPKQEPTDKYGEKVIEKTKGWRFNKVLREMRGDKSLRSTSGDFKSGDLLGFMRESPVAESTGQHNLKSMLEESIESTRRHKKETLKSLGANRTKSTKYTTKPAPQWVEKSLEDLQKTLDNQTEPLQKNVDPALNQQIKDILSELQIAPKQFGTANSIVAAVENWGKSTQVFTHRKIIQNEYQHQTNEMLSLTSPRSGLSLLDGERTGLFDDIISKAKTAKLNTVTQSTFLFHLEDLDKVNRVDSIGIKRSAFTDQIMLSNRLWQYPIDNEVCKVEEQNTSFEEHVFLEYLLDDFPSKGPVRRFMELVINGLQQNPYMTVKQKKQRVHWFHDYFSNFSEEELNF